MKRICFDGDPLFAEIVNLKKIEEILTSLLQQGDVECWFYGSKRPIMDQAIEVIIKMRKDSPDVKITVIDVIDPIQTDIGAIDRSEQEADDDFPPDVIDKFVAAPIFEGRAENNPNFFITHQKKIKKWMYMQCDIVALYHYDLLPFSSISTIENMYKKGQIELIKICDQNTIDLIRKKAETLEGEDGIFYRRRIKGDTYKEMADMLNVSVPRISQRTRMAIARLGRIVKAELNRQGKLYQSFPKLVYRLQSNKEQK